MRRPVNRRKVSKVVSISAPTRGLVVNQPIAASDPSSAEVVQNFLPTRRGLKVRGGISRAAYVADPVMRLFSYADPLSPVFLAATADAIYPITSLDPIKAPTAVVAGLTSGAYSVQQIGTVGGSFLICVNGADDMQLFDGSTWNPVNAQAVNQLSYDALTSDFVVGELVTGATSGASAPIVAINPTGATAGTLKLGAITSGPFQDNEAIGSASGAATANGPSSSASAVTITGVGTDDLCHVWLYRNRLFFVEANTLSAWYLPVDSIGGAAQAVSLAGVFKRGGALLLGATWSLDSGDGIDDKCVFVSTGGEVAIFEGADPSSLTHWTLVGRYDIGRPLGKNATMQAGGDLLVATVDGIVPLSQVIQKDPAALSLAAVTKPIEKIWNFEAGRAAGAVELLKWTDGNLGCVVLPDAERMLTVNLQTGAWGEQTGWRAECAGLFGNDAYIGRGDGRIYRINDTGTDDGTSFTARYCHSFNDFGNAATYKRAQMVRFAFFSGSEFNYKAEAAFDYNIDFTSAPGPASVSVDFLIWGVGNWGESLWYGDETVAETSLTTEWRSVTGAGYTIAPMLQITSGGVAALNLEMVRVDLSFEEGGVVV
ncbi:MAG: hypothetical protein AAF982_03875 [Pseudomonadota bacterium]